MKQLIQIESVPIKIDMKTTWARFEKPDPLRRKLDNINSSPVQNKSVHSYQNISSMRRQNLVDIYENDSYESDSKYADMLSSEMFGRNKSAVFDFVSSSSDYVRAAVQSSHIQAEQHRSKYGDSQEMLNAEAMKVYDMDRASFDMNVGLGIQDFEFVPASVEFTVTQRPEVHIKYIGSPIYVPPSSAPEYIDTMA